MKEYISDLEELKRKLTAEEQKTLHYRRMYEQAQKDYLNTLRAIFSIDRKFTVTIVITTLSLLANAYFLFFN